MRLFAHPVPVQRDSRCRRSVMLHANVVLLKAPCLGMPLPACLHACRACRQSVHRGEAFGSERAWGHEVSNGFLVDRGNH
jgi:hypothetical protein